MGRRAIVGVMGSGSEPHRSRSEPLGALLASLGVHLLTGGGQGVMAAVSRAFAEAPRREGLVLGILPAEPGDPTCRSPEGYPNRWVEVPIRTHLPWSGPRGAEPLSRNHLNVLTAEVVVILPGGAGTASEASLAIRYRRPAVAWLDRREDLPGLPGEVPVVRDLEEVRFFLLRHLEPALTPPAGPPAAPGRDPAG